MRFGIIISAVYNASRNRVYYSTYEMVRRRIRKKVFLSTNKNRFYKLLQKYPDEETLVMFVENNISKYDRETATDYSELIKESNLKKDTKDKS